MFWFTYHLQFFQFHESLLHSRLVHLHLLILFEQSKFVLFLALADLGGVLVDGARFVLVNDISIFPQDYKDRTSTYPQCIL